jgi:hypothetical protein
MYRIGHGDCFLLAFAGDKPGKPVYVLIDCGYKPGSPGFINTKPAAIARHIVESTGGFVNVAVITHEHQDHVNAITAKNFKGLKIGEAWFAWTEDPGDDLANQLRRDFKDKLVGLVAARNRLAADEPERAASLDEFLAYEFGGDDAQPFSVGAVEAFLAAEGGGSKNKQAMKVFKDLGKEKYLRPHTKPRRLPGAKDVRVFVAGPPRDTELLGKLDPEGDEAFQRFGLANTSSYNYFAAAAAAGPEGGTAPFDARFAIPKDTAHQDEYLGEHFRSIYGGKDIPEKGAFGIQSPCEDEAPGNPEWRRIDNDWLLSTEMLALAMNSQTNNSSLVLAFELGKGGKVLFFAADAQRGNWISWADKTWKDGDETITARDLLSRTVLYKVGHHGSHNATLNGAADDEYPNLSWMAEGEYAQEFCAMITAVREWAQQDHVKWDHPLKSIKDALLKKAGGRVFQTDTDFNRDKKWPAATKADWDEFCDRVSDDPLYFELRITR